ncbi:MAG: exodeoxyribonuclease VII large subunit [Gemmatimonadetes bacterium]|nr:exodeoxyribonuclease VII large subunit [Gemmatimonadota bacterium]
MGGDLDFFLPSEPSSSEGAWTVAQVTSRARQLVESGMRPLWIKGEVSGFKTYRSGHWYFSLRDSQAQVRCVMWRTDNQRIAVKPEDGLQVFVEGRPTVWEERGEFRITVKRLITTDADGQWEVRLQEAKAALQRDGLLDPARRRPLPAYPSRVAIVTSPDGAALHDLCTVLERRWPAAEVLLLPTRVQGDLAERELCRALELLNRITVDVAIVGRGGGSREDLWAFNSERVARAVAAVQVPIISAVGHEEDVALTDLVADVRAPTPSAAAEAVVPDRLEVSRRVEALAGRLAQSLGNRTRLGRERLERTGDRLHAGMAAQLDRRSSRLATLAGKLEALSPLRVLQRGYAVARDEAGNVLGSRESFKPNMDFRVTVADGEVKARVRGGDA